MKKSFMLIAAAAAMFAACQQEDVIVDQSSNNNVQQAIGFSTYTPSMTRAENSSATSAYALENYHETFYVWGYKNIKSTSGDLVATEVFDEVKCEYSDKSGQFPGLDREDEKDWIYSPIRYWDKSATDYDFYAAAPSSASWVLANEDVTDTETAQAEHGRYFTIEDAVVKGESLPFAKSSSTDLKVTGQPKDHFVGNDKDNDLMIATDVLKYDNYTKDRVNFHFNHILSRLNIGVKTTVTSTTADPQTLKLNVVKVYNMYSKGNFDESKVNNTTSSPTLAAGTAGRWSDQSTLLTVGFPNAQVSTTEIEISSDYTSGTGTDAITATPADFKLVYQGLVIPQSVAYDGTLKLDGSNAVDGSASGFTGTASKPYVYIEYELNGETFKSYFNLAALFNGSMLAYKNVNNNPAYKTIWDGVYLFKSSTGYELEDGTDVNYGFNDGDKFYGPNGKEIYFNGTEYYGTFDGTNYGNKLDPQPEYWVAWNKYHNPIAVTNVEADKTTYEVDVDFCEGWQYNLWITIDPVAILFDASVYEWATKDDAPVTVK